MDSIITLNTEQKDLSIRVHSNGFSFYLSDSDGEIEHQQIYFNTLSPQLTQLKDAIYGYPILFSGFRSYNLIVEAVQYIFTPSLLFDPVAAQKQTKLLFTSDQTKEYFFEEILPLSIVNCYSFNAEIYGFLNRTFQFNQVVSLNSLLILNAQKPEKGKVLHLYVNDTSIHIIVYASTGLEFQATHPKLSVMNCCYYALKTWELYQMDQKEDHLLLIGDIEYGKMLKPHLTKYIDQIEIKQAENLTSIVRQSSQKIIPNIF